MKESKVKITRRQLLKGATALGTASVLFPQIVPRHVVGGAGFTPPSETVYVACVGAGYMGTINMRSVAEGGDGAIVAVAETDQNVALGSMRTYPKAKQYIDYREMLEKEKGIDAVIVATPDHSHASVGITVMDLDKHIYCEKPLARTVYEIRKMREAAHRNGVVHQMGNQGHSFAAIREFCECVWSGAIGEVKEVHATQNAFRYSRIAQLGEVNDDHAIPDGLDWKRWLGPALDLKYNPMYHPGKWRGWRQFGGGNMGDFVCHIIDPVFWALNLGAPSSVIAEADGYDPTRHGLTFPESSKTTFTFPARGSHPPVELTWYDGDKYSPPHPKELAPGEESIPVPGWVEGKAVGAMVVGDKGTIVYGSHGAKDWRILGEGKMEAYMGDRKRVAELDVPGPPGNFTHVQEWLRACKGWKKSESTFDYGGPLTEIALVGNIALLYPETKLHWDSEHMTFPNQPSANQFLHSRYRDDWML